MYIPDGVKYISPKAFAHNTGIKKLYLPDSLKMIFESAFLDMNELQFVDFGKGIRHIGSENSQVYSGYAASLKKSSLRSR